MQNRKRARSILHFVCLLVLIVLLSSCDYPTAEDSDAGEDRVLATSEDALDNESEEDESSEDGDDVEEPPERYNCEDFEYLVVWFETDYGTKMGAFSWHWYASGPIRVRFGADKRLIQIDRQVMGTIEATIPGCTCQSEQKVEIDIENEHTHCSGSQLQLWKPNVYWGLGIPFQSMTCVCGDETDEFDVPEVKTEHRGGRLVLQEGGHEIVDPFGANVGYTRWSLMTPKDAEPFLEMPPVPLISE